jgi:hypothetical protein
MEYGALSGLNNEAREIYSQNGTNRLRPLSAIFLSLMTASLLFLMSEKNSDDTISDVQSAHKIRSYELKHNAPTTNFTGKTLKKRSSLIADNDDSEKAGLSDVLSLSTLLKGSMKVQCSDSVSWGRLGFANAALTNTHLEAFDYLPWYIHVV